MNEIVHFFGPGPKNKIANVLISVSTQFGTNKINSGLEHGTGHFQVSVPFLKQDLFTSGV